MVDNLQESAGCAARRAHGGPRSHLQPDGAAVSGPRDRAAVSVTWCASGHRWCACAGTGENSVSHTGVLNNSLIVGVLILGPPK